MWISRKKYEELTRELASLRLYAEVFDDFLKNSIDQAIEEEEKIDTNGKESDITILTEIMKSDKITRTQICDEIGITFKTLRNIIEGKPVKPSTREKVRNYIYNKNGTIKNGILDILNKE